MLVVVQIPIVDLRNFTLDVNRLPVPGWPAPEPDIDFLRGFGAIRRRPSGGLNGWLGEAVICEVARGLRFAGPLPQTLVTDAGHWSLRVAYRRFFSDGIAAAKIEIGFDVRPIKRADLPFRIDDVVAELLKLPLSVRGESARFLGAAGRSLARAYARASTSHFVNPETAYRFVLAGRPAVIIEHSGRPLCTPRTARSTLAEELSRPTVTFWHQRIFSADLPVWLLSRPRKRGGELTRELRLYLCRFHAETEAISKTLRAVSVGVVAPAPRSPQSDRLQRFLLDAFRHQRQVGRKLDAKSRLPFYEAALWHRDHALPGYYEGLLTRITAINPRAAVQTAVANYVDARRSQDDRATIIVFGDYVMTENKVTNSGVIGVVGETNNSTVTANQTTFGGASNDAIAQLETLAKVLEERASNPDEEVGAEAIKKAAEKLSKGDEPGALAWLKRSGAWALKVAEDVGATLAAELIIRASTN